MIFLRKVYPFILSFLILILFYFNCLYPVDALDLFYDNFDSVRENWDVKEQIWQIIQEDGNSNHVYKVSFDPRDTRALVIPSNGNTFDRSDYILQGKMLSKNGVDQYFWFRVSPDLGSYYMVDLRATGWIDSDNIRVIKKINNERVWLYQIDPPDIGCSILHDKWYELSITVEGTTIGVDIKCPESQNFRRIFFIDDQANPLTIGGIGLSAWSGSWSAGVEKWFDEIKVTSLETSSATPLVIIPGLGASWNTKAMVYDQDIPQEDWEMTPFVNVYDRIVKTAEGAGYSLGNDLFIWNYDWRKPVSEIAGNLDQFIQTNQELNSVEKIDFVGHSLGGLVARTWNQNYDTGQEKKTKNLITVGSPHYGVVQAYQVIAGGQVGDKLDLTWLALQLFLQIKKDGFMTNAEAIRGIAPVLRDLVPIFNFIKKCNQEIPADKITYPNNFLFQLNQNSNNVLPFSSFIVGNKGKTTQEKIITTSRSVIDELLNLWPDGHPQETILGDGDGTVLKRSAYLEGGYNPDLEYQLGHREIISDSVPVEKILNILGKDNVQILGQDPYPEDNLLVFYLASPATLEVDGLTPPDNNLQFIIISNPESKNYQAKVSGTETGIYHLFVGQITPTGNFWQKYEGEIEDNQVKSYDFNINQDNPLVNPLIDENGRSHLSQAKKLLEELYAKTNNRNLSKSLNNLSAGIIEADNRRWKKAISKIKTASYYLARFGKETDEKQDYYSAKKILEEIALAWENILRSNSLASKKNAEEEYRLAKIQYFLALKLLKLAKFKSREIRELRMISVKESEILLDLLLERKSKGDYAFVEPHGYLAFLFALEGTN